jgi:hypothetical protein
MAAAAAAAVALHEKDTREAAGERGTDDKAASDSDALVMPPKASHLKKIKLKKLYCFKFVIKFPKSNFWTIPSYYSFFLQEIN